jgi:aspartate racemase
MRSDAENSQIHGATRRRATSKERSAAVPVGAPGVLIGVLGGMGPAATLDFLGKIIAATPAGRDQDHIPVAVWSNPRIADRNKALLVPGSPSPAADLQYGARQLETLGASFLAIACNTAHHWHAEIQRAVAVPVLHIADLAVAALGKAGHPPGTPVGLLCSDGTLASGYYDVRLEKAGFTVVRPTSDMQTRMMAAIHAVKIADLKRAGELSRRLADEFRSAGAAVLLLGCTELPIALGNDTQSLPSCLDATACLAEACVARATALAAPQSAEA